MTIGDRHSSTNGIAPATARNFTHQSSNVVLNGFGDAGAVGGPELLSREQGVGVAYSSVDMSTPTVLAIWRCSMTENSTPQTFRQ